MVKIAKHISLSRLRWLRDAGLTIAEIARALQVSTREPPAEGVQIRGLK